MIPKLFSSQMRIIQLKAHNQEDVEEMLKFQVEQLKSHYELSARNSIEGTANAQSSENIGLVIDGKTLSYCLNPQPHPHLIRLLSLSSSVLCCRATPTQKAEVVKVVKEKLGGKTLGIGDGANDVAMIQSADVGVGINGQEGMQAVMASDYALPRFRFLNRLLLVHGHWSYDRLARTIQYFFYENALFVLALFWFQFFSGFSSQTTVDPMYLVLYSVLFTGLPPLFMGVLDQTAHESVMIAQPKLYHVGRNSTMYRRYSFWISIAYAVWQSGVIFFYSYLSWGQALSIVGSILFYVTFSLVYNAAVPPDFHVDDPPVGVAEDMMGNPIFYLSLFYIVILSNIPKFIGRVVRNCLKPSPVLLASMKFQHGNCQ